MGQIYGKLQIDGRAQPFVNLPSNNVKKLMEAVQLICEDFHIPLAELHEIFKISIRDCYSCGDEIFKEMSIAFFCLLDNDEKCVVDSFELLSAFIITSDMDVRDKVREIVSLYNFDNDGEYNINEVTMSLRSSVSAMVKIANLEQPDNKMVDFFASLLFPGYDRTNVVQSYSDLTKTSDISVLTDLALSLPEITSWLHRFDDLDEIDIPDSPLSSDNDVDYKLLFQNRVRNSKVSSGNWKEMVQLSASRNYEVEKSVSSIPNVKLELTWIYGKNSNNISSNNAFYTESGGIVYPAGAVVVNHERTTGDEDCQRMYMRHKTFVSCIAVSHSEYQNYGSIVASSEYISYPSINVWSTRTLATLQVIVGFHANGVQCLDFSPSGKLLLTMGADENHSIAIYDWKESRILYSTTTSPNFIHQCKFLGSDCKFGVSGDAFFHIWERTELPIRYRRKRCLFGKAFKIQAMTCIVNFSGKIITGGKDGGIYMWEGRSCVKSIDVSRQKASIVSFSVSSSEELCAATIDGLLMIYNDELELCKTFHTNKLINGSKINSLDWRDETILLGTTSSDLIEIWSSNGTIKSFITKGYSKLDSYQLSINPGKVDEFVSVGDNGILRFYNLQTNQVVKTMYLDVPVSCVSYSSDGKKLVIAKDIPHAGEFIVLCSDDLSIKVKDRPCSRALIECKHSRDGKYVVFGSENHKIYIYEGSNYTLISRATGHTSPVHHIDLGYTNNDNGTSYFIRSNSENDEVMFWDLHGNHVTPMSQRNTIFETCNCPLSLEMLGAHKKDQNVVENCDKSNNGNMVAFTTKSGSIRLINYPAYGSDQKYFEVFGHGGPVCSVQFSNDDSHLLTIGGFDGCLMQWKYTDIRATTTINIQNQNDTKTVASHVLVPSSTLTVPISSDIRDSALICGDRTNYDTASWVKPWQKNIVVPSNVNLPTKCKPPKTPILDCVIGYNGSYRNNIFYTNKDKIIYPIGRNLISFDIQENNKSIFLDAEDIITCVAIHPNRNICAIGQGTVSGHIICLDHENMQTKQILKTLHRHHHVQHIKFNKLGNHLVTISNDNFHTIQIYDWEIQSSAIISSPTVNVPIHDIAFTVCGQIIQVGEALLRYWSVTQGSLSYVDVNFGNETQNRSFHSIVAETNLVVTGTDTGTLCQINKNHQIAEEVNACDTYSPILTLNSCSDAIISGSKDGHIKIWNKSFSCIMQLTLKELGSLNSEISSIGWSKTSNKVLVGTDKGAIFEFSAIDGSNLHTNAIVSGPSGKELSGLAISPNKTMIVTTSDDKMLNIWNVYDKRLLQSIQLDTASKCCSFSANDVLIAIGHGSSMKKFASETPGKWSVMNIVTLSTIFHHRPSRKMITEIKWSDNHIAVGSQDCKVYLYHVDYSEPTSFEATLRHTIDQHYSPISHIDFSVDSNHLKVNCQDNLYFFNVEDGSYILEVSSIGDVKWKTHNCCFSYDVAGIWSHCKEDIQVLCVDAYINNHFDRIVAGFSDGNIGLFHYPCVNNQAPYCMFKAHYGPVKRILWLDGTDFISIGLDDKAIMIWNYEELYKEEGEYHPEKLLEAERDQLTKIHSDDVETCNWMASKKSRPWMASAIEPIGFKATRNEKSSTETTMIDLHSISGLHGDNLQCVNQDEIITNAGAVCLVSNLITNEQKVFRGHIGMITSIAYSSSHLIASGDDTSQGNIRIWDINTCTEIICLNSLNNNGIRYLTFTDSDKTLITLGSDQNHCVSIWRSLSGEWFDGILHLTAQTGLSVPHFLAAVNNGENFVIGEDNGVTFWDRSSCSLAPTKGKICDDFDRQSMLCCATHDKGIVTGAKSGHIYLWEEQSVSSKVVGHDSATTCLLRYEKGYVSGSERGVILTWNAEFQIEKKFDLKQYLGIDTLCYIQSLSLNTKSHCNRLLIGVEQKGIYEISTRTSNVTCCHEAHSNIGRDAVFHPSIKNIFASCDDRGIIRLWNHNSNTVKEKTTIPSIPNCMSWSSDGAELLVGCAVDGNAQSSSDYFTSFIIDIKTMKLKWKGNDCKKSVIHAKFGPNSTMFALVDETNKILIYDNKDRCKSFKPRLRVMTDFHKAPITSIDFSKDAYYIQTSSKDYDHIRFNTDDGEIMNLPSQLRNIEWDTYTCPFGWAVQGLWPPVSESQTAPEPTSVCRSKNGELIAVGFSNGEVRLYDFPCISYPAPYIMQTLHVGPVSRCSFNSDTTLLLTIGQNENHIVTWRISKQHYSTP